MSSYLELMLDVAVLTNRQCSDIQRQAARVAKTSPASATEVLRMWKKNLSEDPLYILPGDEDDPRNPKPLGK